ncbi:MAG: hypothetical protein ABGW91_02970 [Christiangramia sp.]
MNYIRHLNEVFSLFDKDDRLNPSHISLYMALFQEWNSSRFSRGFWINRREMMNAAKIGAKSTYHRCIWDLHNWNYLVYIPSNNPYKGSKINMSVFGTTAAPVEEQCRSTVGQLMNHSSSNKGQVQGHNINSYKEKNILKEKEPMHPEEMILFFKNRKRSKNEALTFYNHYEAIGWKMSSGMAIINWKNAAEKWILKLENSQASQERTGLARASENLRTTKIKNYGEPL